MEQKSKSKLPLVVVVIVAVAAIGATAYALTRDPSSSNTAEQSDTTPSNEATSPNPANSTVVTPEDVETVIVFTDTGFKPSNYTSKDGEAVTVRNDSSMDLEFASDDHPTHRDNPELNLDVLSPGESGTFTPPGKGTYKFHDHINDQFTGSITVE